MSDTAPAPPIAAIEAIVANAVLALLGIRVMGTILTTHGGRGLGAR